MGERAIVLSAGIINFVKESAMGGLWHRPDPSEIVGKVWGDQALLRCGVGPVTGGQGVKGVGEGYKRKSPYELKVTTTYLRLKRQICLLDYCSARVFFFRMCCLLMLFYEC